ncbi:hypothetical protein OIU91_41560 (plasmid) [Streptomyces sp. NBC_01456]|uniref:hypothetical protein n=1 Tax=unclassified Streptomyces TaxID=2593676 RepID=UPI002E3598E1|nr:MULTISPECIES: hypothetical protein [unclassified Streptomyces]
MLTHTKPQQKDITYDPKKQEFVWPITVHRLDGTTEDTSLVITPDQFAVLAVQIDRAEDRRREHLSGPSTFREGL